MIPDLETPVPVVGRLPVVLQEDARLRRFSSAFDDLFAPVYLTLDSLACYVDPALAPGDFLDWLCGWVGVEPDESWTVERRRELVGRAAELNRRRGTVQGIAEQLGLLVDGTVTVTDSGGVAWSAEPGGDLPGSPTPWLRVTVRVADPENVDRAGIERALRSVTPAHVPAQLTVEAMEP